MGSQKRVHTHTVTVDVHSCTTSSLPLHRKPSDTSSPWLAPASACHSVRPPSAVRRHRQHNACPSQGWTRYPLAQRASPSHPLSQTSHEKPKRKKKDVKYMSD